MRKLIIFSVSLFLLSVITPESNGQTITIGGTINKDTTLNASLVKVTSELIVTDNHTLTLLPGTTVEFQGHYEMKIDGTLLAEGRPGDSIIFTCRSDLISTGWAGIDFYDQSGNMLDNDSSIFDYCKFIHAVSNESGGVDGAALTFWWFSRARISNCLFEQNNQHPSGVIFFRDHASPILRYNTFKNNTGYVMQTSSAHPVIENNSFINNTTGIYVNTQSEPIIRNNLFAGNNTAIRTNRGQPLITGNIIVNNDYGLYLGYTSSDILNNSICNNLYGIFLHGVSHPDCINNIIWGNQYYQVSLNSLESQPVFYYNDISGGQSFSGAYAHTGAYENNLNTLPQFQLPSGGTGRANYQPNANWSLKINSPCLNAGQPDLSGLKIPERDFNENPRIKYGFIDMGGIEYQRNYLTVCGTVSSPQTWFADTIKVTCNVTVIDNVVLTILPGTVVEFQGHYEFDVDGTIVSMGTPENKIIYTVKDTTGFSDRTNNNGSWGGIVIINSGGAMDDNDTTIFENCRFEFCKETGSRFGAVIENLDHARLTFERCTFINNYNKNSGGAVSVAGSGAIANFSHCRFENNQGSSYGGAVYLRVIQHAYFDDNTFYMNQGNRGGAIAQWGCPGTFTNNKFQNNTAGSGGAMWIYEVNHSSYLNNLYANNSASSGGGISYRFSVGNEFINNTIVNNTGYGIHTYSAPFILYNSVLWGNQPAQIYLSNLTSTPNIFFSNLEGGTESIAGQTFIGIEDHVIDTDPFFVNPTSMVGVVANAMDADWSLLPISLCINAGLNEPPDIPMPGTDIEGNPRINDGVIDIGAHENHSAPLLITEQPSNFIKCTGDSVVFATRTAETAFFQWVKDGKDIPGATNKDLIINSVSLNDEGNYQCRIWNSYDTLKGTPVYLLVRASPSILSQPSSEWFAEGQDILLEFEINGTAPFEYTWFKNNIIIPGENSSKLNLSEASVNDEGLYFSTVSNFCGEVSTNAAILNMAPGICIVTVDPETGDNLIVWEKRSSAPILSYNIYRESEAAGIYDLLVTMPYDDLSIYTDSLADPTVQSYLYKITAIDTSGTETDIDLCNPHKTIHLIVSPDLQSFATNLQWDRYYGFEYQTYTIYRSPTGLNFDPVGSISANIYSWSDREPGTENHYYRIAVEKPDPCYPTGAGKKAKTGPYNHSLSNMDDNKLKSGQLPPDTITITNNSILEESSPGTLIGKLLTEDKDTVDSHTYKFVQGQGDEDNLSFTLLGDLLFSSEFFDFETKAEYTVRIRSTDESENYCEVPFLIQILDIDETTGLPGLGEGVVSAFPNPFTQATTISFPNPGNETFRMTLMDLSGKLVRMQDNITTQEFILRRDGLEKGLYLIDIKGDKTYRGKLIIE